MAFRHLGGSPKKALPGEMLLVVREYPRSFGIADSFGGVAYAGPTNCLPAAKEAALHFPVLLTNSIFNR
jgi:hypothetical protein